MDNMNLVSRQNSLPPPSSEVTQAVYCYLESTVGKSRSLRVACVGREHCRPDYLIEREGYVCYGLELVVQGRGELQMHGKTFRLLPGHLFLYGPGVKHSIRCDSKAPMIKYFADFFGGSERELFAPGVIQPGEIRRTPELELLGQLFDALIREGKKVTPARREICAQYMKLLLLKSTEAGSEDEAPFSQSLSNLSRCRAFIEENATVLSGLQAVADAVHLDPRYICRLFKRFHLVSPHRYLVACRMNRAAELLVTTQDAVKAVAAQCGYGDPLHFSRAFRQQFACSPSEFRSQSVKYQHPGGME